MIDFIKFRHTLARIHRREGRLTSEKRICEY